MRIYFVWVCILMSVFYLTGCGAESTYQEKLIGSWYVLGEDSPAFIFYDDNTCGIAGEYGDGTWSIIDKDKLRLSNYYGEIEIARIKIMDEGKLILEDGDREAVFYSHPSGQRGSFLDNNEKSIQVSEEKNDVTDPEVVWNPDTGKGNVEEISLGMHHSAVIDEYGNLWVWGANDFGMVGDGSTEDRHEPVKIMENIVSVDLGVNHSAAIDSFGNLWTWGKNNYGQLGDGTIEDRHSPVKIMENVKYVSLGVGYTAAIDTESNLWMWGYNYDGQLGDGTTEDKHSPAKVMENVKYVSLGGGHSAAIDTSWNLWMWGADYYGQCGHRKGGMMIGDGLGKSLLMENIMMVSLGGNHSAAIDRNGNLWTWGQNNRCQVGDGTTMDCHIPQKIMENIVGISLGWEHSTAVDTSGNLWAWGNNDFDLFEERKEQDLSVPTEIIGNVKKVSAGGYHNAVIGTSGNMWTWGQNEHGQLGNGKTGFADPPLMIPIFSN